MRALLRHREEVEVTGSPVRNIPPDALFANQEFAIVLNKKGELDFLMRTGNYGWRPHQMRTDALRMLHRAGLLVLPKGGDE